jgi:hypothetical protein
MVAMVTHGTIWHENRRSRGVVSVARFSPKPGHPAAHAAQSALARHDPADVPSHSQHARLRRERELWETAAKRRVSRPKSPPDDRTNARQSVAPPLRPSTQPTRAPTIMASRAVAVREHGVARHEVHVPPPRLENSLENSPQATGIPPPPRALAGRCDQ